MHMKKVILFIAVITLVACKSRQEKDIEKMNLEVKKLLEDRAFKLNSTIDFKEFKFIKCDTLNENDLLSNKAKKYQDATISFYQQASNELEFARLNQRKMVNYRDLGWSTLFYSEKEEFKDHMDKAQSLKDSALYYTAKDSILQKQIANNKKPKSVYEPSYFVKATIKGKESTNLLDTMYFLFDDKIIHIKN